MDDSQKLCNLEKHQSLKIIEKKNRKVLKCINLKAA